MFENTNQTEATIESDGSDMFLDEQTSKSEETTEKETKAEEDTPNENADEESSEADKQTDETKKAEKPAEKDPTIRVKFNGEEKDIPIAEATILAQKGMNYDKVVKERDELVGGRDALRELDEWANQLGIPRAEVVKTLTTQRAEVIIQNALQEVQAEYPEITEKAALEIAKTRTAEKRKQIEEATAAAAEAEKLKPWQEFATRYPNIKDANDIPESVVNEMAAGASPTEAMQRHEIAELKKQNEELQRKLTTETKNTENKLKSTGSAASKAAKTPIDAFSAGYDSD